MGELKMICPICSKPVSGVLEKHTNANVYDVYHGECVDKELDEPLTLDQPYWYGYKTREKENE
jgi:hypothetical protein|tara:strand:+ start:1181 stop:1369 length:189 start_codon:yes stop_codon:yes gene_type:complete